MVVDGAHGDELAEIEGVEIGLLDELDKLLDAHNVAEDVADGAQRGVVRLVGKVGAELPAGADDTLICNTPINIIPPETAVEARVGRKNKKECTPPTTKS